MPRNCSKKGASHASHTRNPSALSTSSTGSTVKPTTPPVDYSKDTPSSGDASKPPTTQPTPTSTHSVAPSSEPSPAPASTGGSGDVSQADITAYLTAQNNIRGNHGAANLTWNADLSAKALSWASKCKFQHSDGTLGPFGENLAAGTGDAYTIASAVKSWTDEVSDYDPNNPQPSHFTQVVWKATTQVGCAYYNCSSGSIFPAEYGVAHYHVCEYSPPGNVIGEFAQNVQA
ncbi:CAP domain-containing protein [Russula ochroleuca]|uniref:CAP domain-containing protein n=1 Tax=Russula ochroleuca TaxID=152965 RepID=A0A9P5MXM9_9AGAM|nr:CAP domain-containing protein [Russula ochroleuca]